MQTLRNVGEIGLGLSFLIGTIFNLSYTLRHGEEFFESFAANAWFPLSRTLMRAIVIPRARLFTALLIATQVTAAALILSRGTLAGYGLIIGAAFALFAALVSSLGGAIANLLLAATQVLLALARWSS
jgi:hypothetical protein